MMFRLRRITMGFGVLLLLLGMAPLAPHAHAQNERCFRETNQCISGHFLQYWEKNGGLAVFGYPVGPARDERNRDTGKVYLTQWFERNRFELHPENAAPYDVLLGLLGGDRLLQQGRNWQSFPTAPESAAHRFPQTGHAIAHEPFWNYWSTHGLEFDGQRGVSFAENLALFGYPISEPAMETNLSGDRVLTQWFERARFEYHPSKPEPFKVLLGLLGNELRQEAPKPTGAHPPISYVDGGGDVWELRSNGDTVRLGNLSPALGRVIDAVKTGNQIVLLRERGLQSIVAQETAKTIATFTKGDAIGGALLAPTKSNLIVYSYTRNEPENEFGTAGIVGVIDGTSARKVFEAPQNLGVLGLTADGKHMHVIHHGQDPSFTQVAVVALDSGRVVARLPFSGEGAYAESPDRRTIVTVTQAGAHPDTLVFYDLNNQTGAPRNATPHRGWNIWQVLWGRSSRVVYALVAPTTDQAKHELWRVDAETRRSELVARNLPTDLRLLSISEDDGWLIGQTQQGALLLDLATGGTRTDLLPQTIVIARPR